ncbi:MAG: alginate export family protein [Candidatus Omnitrophica bacterium]|nr:alginate export family protein [Candidatus Omnitrophota bacterium]
MRKFLLALAVVAVAAMPAFASVQNLKVSGNIDSSYVSRTNFDFGVGSNQGNLKQSFFMTQADVKFDADLTDNVSTTVDLINERVWGQDQTAENGQVDVNLAYVTLREMLYSPLTVVVGRQQFSFGNNLIVSSGGTNIANDSGIRNVANDLSKQHGFDAIRAILDYNPLTIQVFAAKITKNNASVTAYSENNDLDRDLFGTDATYAFGDKMNSQVEGYFFGLNDKTGNGNAGSKTNGTYTPGIRVSMNPIERLNVQAEYAHQFGTYSTGTNDNRTRNANAAQFLASYKIPVLEKYAPVAKYAFTYVSGDVNGTSGSTANYYTGWNAMFEDQGYLNGYSKIYNAMFGLSNLVIHEVSFEAKPMQDITTSVGWSGLWLSTPYDSLAGSFRTMSGTYATYNMNPNKSFLGNEFDGTITYAYTEDVKIGSTIGMFVPGKAFANANNDDNAVQAMVNMNVAF